jgi:hypothetical protein
MEVMGMTPEESHTNHMASTLLSFGSLALEKVSCLVTEEAS